VYNFYRLQDVMGAAAPGYVLVDQRQVVLPLILRERPPGMAGVWLAGVLAPGLSSLNSALNAMGSSFVNDWYRTAVPGRDERHYLRAGRWAVTGWGIVLGGFAMGCVHWQQAAGQSLIDFALGVMAFAYSGLVAVFLTALLTRRGNGTSAVLALAVGFVVVLLLQPWAWVHWTPAGWRATQIAFPWQIVIATSLAMAVCCSGKPPTGEAKQPAP